MGHPATATRSLATGYRLAAILIAGGISVAALCALLYPLTYLGPVHRALLAVGVILGTGLSLMGLVSGAFLLAASRSFEWLLAWRYVRSGSSRRSWIAVGVGSGLILLSLAAMLTVALWLLPRVGSILSPVLLAEWLTHAGKGLLLLGAGIALLGLAGRGRRGPRRSWTGPLTGLLLMVGGAALALGQGAFFLQGMTPMRSAQFSQVFFSVSAGVIAVGALLLYFGLLHLAFSVFSCVSVLGVTLGTALLVVVLSVMGGFEKDLRQKILGTLSHIVVTKPKQPFEDYAQTITELTALPRVVAVSPYLESEVMIASELNHGGLLLHGIDPERVVQVNELRQYLAAERGAGRIENLLQPETLGRKGFVPFRLPRRTAVSAPLGGDGPAADATGGGFIGRMTQAEEEGRGLRFGAGPGKDAAEEPGDAAASAPPLPGIIIGAELASNLHLYLGDEVTLVAPLGGMSPMGPIPKARPFRVAGIFYSGMYEYDTKLGYVTLAAAQQFLGFDDEITGLEIKTTSIDHALGVAEAMRRELGEGFAVKDWQQLNRSLFSALKLERVVMLLFLIFIVGVASLSIVTTLIMVVLQKGREVAVLKALGADARAILRVFVYGGVYIGVLGMLTGLFVGVTACVLLSQVGLPLDPAVYYISRLPVDMRPFDIGLIALSALVLSFLATLYPAYLAWRLEPVEGLRWQA